MSGLRIVQVAHAFPPYIGGLSYVVENLSVNLVRLGNEVEVVTLDINGDLPRLENFEDVIVRRFRGWAPDGVYFMPSIEMVKYLKNVEADIIHVHNIGSLLAPLAWFAIKYGRDRSKYVITPHYHESGSKWHTKLLWKPYKPIAKKVIRDADSVHSVSPYEAKLVKRDFRVNPIVISNGVSEDVFSYQWNPPDDKIVLTYAGRVEKYKHLDLIIGCAKILKEKFLKNMKIIVRIIGRGSALRHIIKLSESLNVEVEHYEFLPRSRYLEILSDSTIFINLSMYEAYSIVTAEALAIGIPSIVAQPWGKIFEGIPKAYIVDRNDIERIAKTITEIVKGLFVSSESSTKTRDVNKTILPWSEATKLIVEKIYKEITFNA